MGDVGHTSLERSDLPWLMALTATATAIVEATPQRVLEFVLDMEQYRKIDGKIVRVTSVEGPDADGRGSVQLWGRFPWMPP